VDNSPVSIGVLNGQRGFPGQQMTNPPALTQIVERLQRPSGFSTADGENENENRSRNNSINV
jgi:hypothetical protein